MYSFQHFGFVQDDREEVLQAWYMDDTDDDQRLPHHRNPKEFVSLEKLAGMYFSSTLPDLEL